MPDEGYTWLVASAPTPNAFLERLATYENTPPLYYLLLTPLPLHSVWWIRLPSLISGVVLVGILYAVGRPALDRGTALLASLGLAVAPYAVAVSDFGRGFMLADAELMLCVWAAVRLAEGHSNRWWWLYGLGASAAMYTEYNSVITLLPIVAALVWLRPQGRLRALGLGTAPICVILPWLPQLARSIHDLDVTKTGIGYLNVTPATARDQLVTLYYGSIGQGLGPTARTVLLLVLIAVMGLGARTLSRRETARPLLIVAAFAGIGTFLLTALASLLGIGIFNVGYLTVLIPLGMIPLAAAVGAVPMRAIIPAAAVAIVVVSAVFAYKRSQAAADINVPAINFVLRAGRVQTVLTNSAVVDYYFQARGAILDRPFGLGRGLQQACTDCRRPIAVVDDADVGQGARPGPGTPIRIGHYVVRILPIR